MLRASIELDARELALMRAINRRRRDRPDATSDEAQRAFEARHDCARRLAVYGTLAPGRENAHQLASLAGTWLPDCALSGERVAAGWGADLGFPALRWAPGDPSVASWLFESPDLPQHWPRLDQFEGAEYLRLLVPVHAGARIVAIANVYATPDSRID